MTSEPLSLRPLFAPESIAIIGASDDETRIGGRPVRYLRNASYQGAVYPVNPKRDTVQGLKCYSSLGQIGKPVDCAIIIVPTDVALQSVRDCADAGVKSAIVFSAGFAEVGEEGRQRQDELTRIAKSTGMRILGPNTNGSVNNVTGAYQTFSMATEKPDLPGRVGLVSQSGGYGSYFLHLARQQGLDFAHWVATGNECDVEIGEVMHYMAEDPAIDVIMGYAEGLRNPDSFIGALEAAQRNSKQVVFLKVGSSDVGAKAAASHTAALAGSDETYDAVFREFGVYRARSAEEFVAVAYAAGHGTLPRNRKVAIVTTSGGMGVHGSDYLRERDMDIPQLAPDTQKVLLDIVPHGAAGNPVDTTGQFVNDATILSRMMSEILDREDIDSVLTLLAHAATSPMLAERIIEALSFLPAKYPDRVLSIALAASDETKKALRKAGFLVFDDPARASAALGALALFGERQGRPAITRRRDIPEIRKEKLDRPLNEQTAKALLARHGIAVPSQQVVTSPDAAAKAAAEVGFPVVLKVLSADIAHKTEVGGVVVGLKEEAAVTAAANQIAASVARLKPDAKIDGYLVEGMASGGVECILGLTKDAAFGPIVMFGLGGVSVEVFGDVTFRLAPVSKSEARRMIREIRGLPLLTGHRGKPAADLEALADAIVVLSELGAANADTITSFEINPLLVLPEGKGVVALDAAVELNAPG